MSSSPRFFDAFNYIPNGVFVLDKDFRVRFWNNMMAQISAFSSQEIEHEIITDFYPHLAEPRYYKRIESVFLE